MYIYTLFYCNAAYRCINTYIEFKASTNADDNKNLKDLTLIR
nr:MAG TPA: hypothetical protein [Caudoviricetes sp.]DAQ75760.1 MAG TPA: hypothetical protein [Caudoviricetes sp.]